MAVSASRKARVELVAENHLGPGVKDAERQLRMFAREQTKMAKQQARDQARADKESARERQRTMSSVGGGLKGAGFGIAAAVGFDVAGGIGGIVSDMFDFEKKLVRFQIAARKTPSAMVEMRKSILDVSNETGMAKDQVLLAAQSYLDLAGVAATTPEIMRTISRASQATGTDVHAMATMVYSLGDAMHIPPGEMESTLAGINNQAKDGSAHFKNMAGEMIGMLPRFAQFGVTGRQGAIGMTALFQTIAGGSKSAEETSTIINGMFMGMKRHADRFRASGVEVFNVGKDGAAHLKPFAEIIAEISKSDLMKHPDLLAKAFGRGDGEFGSQILASHVDKIRELIVAGEDATSVATDLQTVLSSPSGKIEAAWNTVKNTIAEALTPERAERFAAAMVKVAEATASFVGFLDKAAKALGALPALGGAIGRVLSGQDWNTDEEKQTQEQAAYQQARRVKAGKLYDADPNHQGSREAYISATIGREEILKENLRAQLDGGTAKRMALNDAHTSYVDKGNYNQAELIKLAQLEQGATNPGLQKMLGQAIGAEVAKAIRESITHLPIAVKVNANDVHGATANAHFRTTTPRGAH